MDLVAYFAYGTTQKGFAHHRRFAGPAGRTRPRANRSKTGRA